MENLTEIFKGRPHVWMLLVFASAILISTARPALAGGVASPSVSDERQHILQQCLDDPLLSVFEAIESAREQTPTPSTGTPGAPTTAAELHPADTFELEFVLMAFDRATRNIDFSRNSNDPIRDRQAHEAPDFKIPSRVDVAYEFSNTIGMHTVRHVQDRFLRSIITNQSQENVRKTLEANYRRFLEQRRALLSELENKSLWSADRYLTQDEIKNAFPEATREQLNILDHLRLLSVQLKFENILQTKPETSWTEIEALGLLNELDQEGRKGFAQKYWAFVTNRTKDEASRLGKQTELPEEEALQIKNYQREERYSSQEIQDYYQTPLRESRSRIQEGISNAQRNLAEVLASSSLNFSSEERQALELSLQIFSETNLQHSRLTRVSYLLESSSKNLLASDSVNLHRERAKELGILKVFGDNILLQEGQNREDVAYEIANALFIGNRIASLQEQLQSLHLTEAREMGILRAEGKLNELQTREQAFANHPERQRILSDLSQIKAAHPEILDFESVTRQVLEESRALEKKIEIARWAELHAMSDFAWVQQEAERRGFFRASPEKAAPISREAFRELMANERSKALVIRWSETYLSNPLSANPFRETAIASDTAFLQTGLSSGGLTSSFSTGPKTQRELWDSIRSSLAPELSRFEKDFAGLGDRQQIEEVARRASSQAVGLVEFNRTIASILSPNTDGVINVYKKPIPTWQNIRDQLQKRELLTGTRFQEEAFRQTYYRAVEELLINEIVSSTHTTSFRRAYDQDELNNLNNLSTEYGKGMARIRYANQMIKRFQKEHPDYFNAGFAERIEAIRNQTMREASELGREARESSIDLKLAEAKAKEESLRWYHRWGNALKESAISTGEALHYVVGGSVASAASLVWNQDFSWGGDYINWVNRYGNANHGSSILGTPEEFAQRSDDASDLLRIGIQPLRLAGASIQPVVEVVGEPLTAVLSAPQRGYDAYVKWIYGLNQLPEDEARRQLDILRRGEWRTGPDGKPIKVGHDNFVKYGNYFFQGGATALALLATRGASSSSVAAAKGSAFLARVGSTAHSFERAASVGRALQMTQTVASIGGMTIAGTVGNEMYTADKMGRDFDWEKVFADTMEGVSQSSMFSVSMAALQRTVIARQMNVGARVGGVRTGIGGRLPDARTLTAAERAQYYSAMTRGARYTKAIDFTEGMISFPDTFEMIAKADSDTQALGALLVMGSNVYDTFDISVYQSINGLNRARRRIMKPQSLDEIRSRLEAEK